MDRRQSPYHSGLIEEIAAPRLRRLYDYWTTRKGSRRFPARRDIDPSDFSYILGNILLFDAWRDPLRVRVRLHGSELARRAGYDLTGRILDDLPVTDFRTHIIGQCKKLVETGEAAVVNHDRVLDGRIQRYEALWLPLSEDGTRVTMLMCGLIYRDRR